MNKTKLEKLITEAYKGFEYKEFEHGDIKERRLVLKEVSDKSIASRMMGTFWDLKTDSDSAYNFSYAFLQHLIEENISKETIDSLREKVLEYADSNTDLYTYKLTEWLNKSDYNIYYLSDALEQFNEKDGFKLLAQAQCLCREEVANKVLDFLEEELSK